MIEKLLLEFMNAIANGEIEIYNEFSFQHEMGIFLRDKCKGYKVQFERNARFFNIQRTIKHEIDIVVYNDVERYAIELKYPLNGQYPEQMFSFIKDVRFMEEVKAAGFDHTYALTLVEDERFYSGIKQDGIYAFFRGDKKIHGIVEKPTGSKREEINIDGTYKVEWRHCGSGKFYLIKI